MWYECLGKYPEICDGDMAPRCDHDYSRVTTQMLYALEFTWGTCTNHPHHNHPHSWKCQCPWSLTGAQLSAQALDHTVPSHWPFFLATVGCSCTCHWMEGQHHEACHPGAPGVCCSICEIYCVLSHSCCGCHSLHWPLKYCNCIWGLTAEVVVLQLLQMVLSPPPQVIGILIWDTISGEIDHEMP